MVFCEKERIIYKYEYQFMEVLNKAPVILGFKYLLTKKHAYWYSSSIVICWRQYLSKLFIRTYQFPSHVNSVLK